MAFYEKALNYILELNAQGVQIMEGTAATFLKKILRIFYPMDRVLITLWCCEGRERG